MVVGVVVGVVEVVVETLRHMVNCVAGPNETRYGSINMVCCMNDDLCAELKRMILVADDLVRRQLKRRADDGDDDEEKRVILYSVSFYKFKPWGGQEVILGDSELYLPTSTHGSAFSLVSFSFK